MEKVQPWLAYLKKPMFILTLICLSFFLRGVFLATAFPMTRGQDEARHYITVQYLAEPSVKSWAVTRAKKLIDFEAKNPDSYRSSEEFRETARLSQISDAHGASYVKTSFAENSHEGANEATINNNGWKKYIDVYPPSKIGGGKFYHWLASLIERSLSFTGPLERFFSARIFSVLSGTLSILASYFIATTIGLSKRSSLMITAMVSLQPKLSVYITNINYDALLILFFSTFTLGAVSFLKQGANWKNSILVLISIIGGLFAKGTAMVLLGPFLILILVALNRYRKSKNFSLRLTIVTTGLIVVLGVIVIQNFSLNRILPPDKTKISFVEFASKSFDRMRTVSINYWGNLNWIRGDQMENFIKIIWALEIISVVGLANFIFSRKKLGYLPQKKYVLFLLIMLAALQIGILYSNWRITASGNESLIASPGRYFIPNLASHIILMSIGLGMLLRKEKYFEYMLSFMLVLMLLFNSYMIFEIIIPRFYL